MTHKGLAYKKKCLLADTLLFRLIFKKVYSTKHSFNSHGSRVKNLEFESQLIANISNQVKTTAYHPACNGEMTHSRGDILATALEALL